MEYYDEKRAQKEDKTVAALLLAWVFLIGAMVGSGITALLGG